MTDYLSGGNDDGGSGGDWLSGGDDYLGLDMDDPPAPTGAPAPPAPGDDMAGGTGGDWLGSSDDGGTGGDWLAGDAPAAGTMAPGQVASADPGQYGGEPMAAEATGYGADAWGPAPAQAPQAPAPAPVHHHQQQQYASAAPANPAMHDLSVQAPLLEEVGASNIALGGARGTLSSLVLDVEVPVEVFFGKARLTVEEFLEMGPGSVVELEHGVDMPIELRVRGRAVARGQLVTINGNYGLRIVEMAEGAR